MTESMLGMPAPSALRPLEPSGFMTKCVRGASFVSWPWWWLLACAGPPARTSEVVAATATSVRIEIMCPPRTMRLPDATTLLPNFHFGDCGSRPLRRPSAADWERVLRAKGGEIARSRGSRPLRRPPAADWERALRAKGGEIARSRGPRPLRRPSAADWERALRAKGREVAGLRQLRTVVTGPQP
ncbi:hypothetical protein AERO9AM_11017 [Aeromicrobium sp. 9AM]|nr:hypothetical protein AERO9AM_11017 [Aeromicrobium sp. 9AM]